VINETPNHMMNPQPIAPPLLLDKFGDGEGEGDGEGDIDNDSVEDGGSVDAGRTRAGEGK
ncbi:hypothetical protein A2U01_0111760, partial [Trifolium medium]|nr:hypothetical protein [Trifolium medium]